MKVLMDFMTLNKQKRAISSPDKKLASSKGSPTFCHGFFWSLVKLDKISVSLITELNQTDQNKRTKDKHFKIFIDLINNLKCYVLGLNVWEGVYSVSTRPL